MELLCLLRKLIKFHERVRFFLYNNFCKKSSIDILGFEETLRYGNQMFKGPYQFQKSCLFLNKKKLQKK